MMHLIMEFIYTARIEIDERNAMKLLNVAEHLGISS